MKSGLFGLLPLVLTMSVTMVSAQTADEQTPAEESVCDPLKADGITKGLYGLCVAFCEAQDHAAVSNPITEADLATIASQTPSGQILENYNKKKQEADPEMPCILVEQPCPCWTAEELNSIDGLISGAVNPLADCTLLEDPATGFNDIALVRELDNSAPELVGRQTAVAWDMHRDNTCTNIPNSEACRYSNSQVTPRIDRNFSVEAGTLTHEQAAACLAQVQARCAELGL